MWQSYLNLFHCKCHARASWLKKTKAVSSYSISLSLSTPHAWLELEWRRTNQRSAILVLCVLWSHSTAGEQINCCCMNVTNFARRISAVWFNSITPSRSLFSNAAYDKTDVIVPLAPPACFSNLWFFSLLDSVIFKCCAKRRPLAYDQNTL